MLCRSKPAASAAAVGGGLLLLLLEGARAMAVSREASLRALASHATCGDCVAGGGAWCAVVGSGDVTAGVCDLRGGAADGGAGGAGGASAGACLANVSECPTLRVPPSRTSTGREMLPTDETMRVDWDSSPMVDEAHRLIFCEQPKVACTEFKRLFMRLIGKPPMEPVQHKDGPYQEGDWVHDPKTNGIPRLSDYSIAAAQRMLEDPQWTKAIFVRDPLEKVLSGYLDKCRMPVEERKSIWHCPNAYGYISFADFLEAIFRAETREEQLAMDRHWRPQYLNCDMDKWIDYYQFSGNFSHLQSHSRYLLESLDLYDDYGHGWRPYGESWSTDGSDGKDLFEEAVHAGHDRHALEKIRLHYTKELADKALEFYRRDYEIFALPRPAWYEQLD